MGTYRSVREKMSSPETATEKETQRVTLSNNNNGPVGCGMVVCG